MKPLTKEQLYQEAEQEWRLYFDNDNPLPSPMSVFIDGYVTCYAKCLGRQHDELVGMLDEVGNAIQSLHNEAVKDFIVSQIEKNQSKQVVLMFKVGWHPASELPVIPEGKNWVKVVALVDFGDNTLRPRHEIYKDKGWSKKICGQLNTGAIHQRRSEIWTATSTCISLKELLKAKAAGISLLVAAR